MSNYFRRGINPDRLLRYKEDREIIPRCTEHRVFRPRYMEYYKAEEGSKASAQGLGMWYASYPLDDEALRIELTLRPASCTEFK